MTEQEKPSGEEEKKPLFEKDELHEASSPDMELVPGVGFVPVNTKAQALWGDEDAVLNALRAKGYSEEAITAFKSGKIIQVNFEQTPFGILRTEKWEGKEENKPE